MAWGCFITVPRRGEPSIAGVQKRPLIRKKKRLTLRILGLSMAGAGPSISHPGPQNPMCLRARILRVKTITAAFPDVPGAPLGISQSELRDAAPQLSQLLWLAFAGRRSE